MTEYRTVTDAKAHLNEIVEALQDSRDHVVVTRHGKPAALVIGWDAWEGLLETVDILRTPGALEEIRQAHEQYLAGEFDTLEQVKKDLLDRGRVHSAEG
jgi:prevent-host-death family protein